MRFWKCPTTFLKVKTSFWLIVVRKKIKIRWNLSCPNTLIVGLWIKVNVNMQRSLCSICFTLEKNFEISRIPTAILIDGLKIQRVLWWWKQYYDWISHPFVTGKCNIIKSRTSYGNILLSVPHTHTHPQPIIYQFGVCDGGVFFPAKKPNHPIAAMYLISRVLYKSRFDGKSNETISIIDPLYLETNGLRTSKVSIGHRAYQSSVIIGTDFSPTLAYDLTMSIKSMRPFTVTVGQHNLELKAIWHISQTRKHKSFAKLEKMSYAPMNWSILPIFRFINIQYL